MIKVLVVDDDKLVRKGLISAMPWADFDMQVVGEANNGEKALEFLASNEVDLMLTDLAMPVMSGIELMRAARRKYPKLFIVVLTLHQDFDYIQEALRLGAIDYIAKVQLEKERFEEVLGRVHSRIKEELKKAGPADAADTYGSDTGYVFLSKDDQPDTGRLFELPLLAEREPEEIDANVWLWAQDDDTIAADEVRSELTERLSGHAGWTVMKLQGLSGQKKSFIHRLLRGYRQKDFFYDYDPSERFFEKSVESMQAGHPAADEESFASLKEQWLSLEWIHQEELYNKLRDQLQMQRLPVPRIVQLLYLLENEWNRVYSSVAKKSIVQPERIDSWHEFESWLQSVRGFTAQITNQAQYSQEVADCIMKAVKIVQEEMDKQLFAVDVARRVNMSRSYFSQCFKDIAGKPFNEYLRHVRIEKAKEYLIHTNKSVQWIAERTGYMDEKYFSRLFREHAGMLPSEFRQSREGRNMSDA
ncbi:response regulator transcription factor [Paenibacillus alkalitolerans]|uniref:response regulator transcription factor n=1 Tax=Paenibacillus alkalitolerans TaxID=2799335 RepID=UPI0018F47A8C|nr:response regulator [Paenibacillus alkalitolerans]